VKFRLDAKYDGLNVLACTKIKFVRECLLSAYNTRFNHIHTVISGLDVGRSVEINQGA
jgi:hypothetical protein